MYNIDLSMKIAIEFSKQYRKKYHRILYSILKVKESRWWKHFENASTYIKFDDVESFMSYFFQQEIREEKIFPHLLNRKHTKELYNTFLKLKDVENWNTTSKEKIENTLKQIVLWSKNNNIKKRKITSFLMNNSNLMKIERGMLYEPLFLFSKKYINGKNIEDIDVKKMVFKVSNPKVFNVIKKDLGDDFNE